MTIPDKLSPLRSAAAAQYTLEKSRDLHFEFYEYAPVGYDVYWADGVIEKINLTGASLLGRECNSLLQHRFSTWLSRTLRTS